jgi:hypothetical protein
MDMGIPLPVVIAAQDNPIAGAGQARRKLPQQVSLADIGFLLVFGAVASNHS